MEFSPYKARDFLRSSNDIVIQSRETSKKLADIALYDSIRKNLEAIGEKNFPYSNIKIHFFGSRIIGLATEESDLDIFVEIDDNFCSNSERSWDHDEKYSKLASKVETDGCWEVKERVLRTAVPIIISIYLPMKLNCEF